MAEREPVEAGHQDLGDDDGGLDRSGKLESLGTILGEMDDEACLIEEVRLQLADMRIAIDAQDQGAWTGDDGGSDRRCRIRVPVHRPNVPPDNWRATPLALGR